MSQQEGAAPVRNPCQVGTLVYTKMGLVAVFFWLLWGDFCFSLMETVMLGFYGAPALLPLTLKGAGASNFWIGLTVGTIPAILSGTICPAVCFWSDRHRGPRGRRIPFLLWPSFFIALFLVLTAYSTDIGTWLHGLVAAHVGLAVSKVSVILVVITFCMVGFQFFNAFVSSVYYCLWADVVPEAFIGRFMSYFRVVGAGSIWVWNYCIFGLAGTHMKAIYIGAGILYAAAFTMMCLRVKEGQYPPRPVQAHGPGFLGSVKTYFHESFRLPYYLLFFLGTTLFSVSSCAMMFAVFFYRDTLKLTLDQIGKVNSWCMVAMCLLLIPAGYLADKLHPLRLVLISHVGIVATNLLCFFFIHNRNSMLVYLMLGIVPLTLYLVAKLPMYVALLPRDRYGQFYSASSLLNSVGMIVGNTLAGLFIDWVGDYRYVFLWQAVLVGAALIPMVLVYRDWHQYGGPENYVPPSVERDAVAGKAALE